MDSNSTGDDRPPTYSTWSFSGMWMVRTRDQTVWTTRSGSRVFLLPLFPERLRRSEGPSLVLATENTIFSTSAACSLTFIRPSEVSTRAPAAALPPNSRGGIDDCRSTGAEDVAQGARCRCCEEFGYARWRVCECGASGGGGGGWGSAAKRGC
jgi:hypothetical protein